MKGAALYYYLPSKEAALAAACEAGVTTFIADLSKAVEPPTSANVKSKHWTRWLGLENRYAVPFNSISKFNKVEGAAIWFALDETRPLACFIWKVCQKR